MKSDRLVKTAKWLLPLVLVIIAFNVNVWLGLLVIFIAAAAAFLLNRSGYYAYRANLAYSRGQKEEALKWFERAVAYENAPPFARISYGYLLLRNGQTEQAEQQFKKALAMNLPREAKRSAELNMALVKWKKGQLQEAIRDLEQVYEDYKTTALYGTLGYLYIEQGDLDQALRFNEEAYDYNDSDAVILDNLGQTCYLRGEYDRAMEIYERLVDKNPAFPEPYFHFGQVWMAKGNKEMARLYFEKALDQPMHHLNTVTREEIKQALAETEQADQAQNQGENQA
jgi:tetratricopeptide (TPR) repeat protein